MMECYSTIKSNKVEILATVSINLEYIIASENSQPRKAIYWMIPFT